MKRDITLFLRDIFEAIQLIEDYCRGISREDFEHDKKLQDAVIRRIEIIGEAAKHVPESLRKKYPNVPWQKIAGVRDVMIHGYFSVLLERVWNILHEDLPRLKAEILKILEKETA